MSARHNVVIAGGGLAGSLVALAFAERRPDLNIMLLERSDCFGGQHVWSFFDSDLEPDARALVEPLISRSWPDHEIAFPARTRILPIGYNSVRSARLDAVVKKQLGPDRFRLGFEIDGVGPDHVTGRGGERIDADVVLDARGPVAMPGLTLGWQKFVGHTYRFASPHGRKRPMIMDGRIEQRDGFRFAYLLPFDEQEMLIEDTYYSDGPELDVARIGAELETIAAPFGAAEMVEQETGLLPVVIAGSVASLWKDARAPLLGIRGGFFHPTTGYSFPDAAHNALLLAGERDWHPEPVHTLLRGRAEQLWRDRGFFRLLNRMLFQAPAPDHRYRVLEHFYRLPLTTISRFYAARLSALDNVRILSGKPPVPLHRALMALRRHAA